MGHKRYTPKSTPYNEEDPLGLIQKEKELEKKLNEPSPVQLFIESEARKKDEARRFRIEKPTYHELRTEFAEIMHKLIGMVVIFECRGRYVKGRIDKVQYGVFRVLERGTKKSYWVDFDECLSIKSNYT